MNEIVQVEVYVDGETFVTDSRNVAEVFGKEHRNVLRDIKALQKDVLNFEQMFFEGTKPDSYGREQPIYYMNRDGFSLLAMGFTGAEAIQWKLKYIDAFNKMEKEFNSPEKVLARGIAIAQDMLANMKVQIGILEPKADYYDQLCDKGNCSNIRDTAKEFGIGQKQLVTWLMDNNYIYRTNGGLRPYMEYTEVGKGYFTLKDTHNANNSWSGQQMYITVKGKEVFRKQLQEEQVLV